MTPIFGSLLACLPLLLFCIFILNEDLQVVGEAGVHLSFISFLPLMLEIEGLRAKRAYIGFWPIFIFLLDRANFSQTDLF